MFLGSMKSKGHWAPSLGANGAHPTYRTCRPDFGFWFLVFVSKQTWDSVQELQLLGLCTRKIMGVILGSLEVRFEREGENS